MVDVREQPEFFFQKKKSVMEMDKGHWPRCLLWRGWLPALSGSSGGFPWGMTEEEVSRNQLKVALESCSSLIANAVRSMPHHPYVWSDGSLVLDKVSGVA